MSARAGGIPRYVDWLSLLAAVALGVSIYVIFWPLPASVAAARMNRAISNLAGMPAEKLFRSPQEADAWTSFIVSSPRSDWESRVGQADALLEEFRKRMTDASKRPQ